MNDYETISATISLLGFGGVIIGLFVAKGQLSKMAESVKIAHDQLQSMAESASISRINTVLQIEDNIAKYKQRLQDVAVECTTLDNKDLAKLKLDAAIENFLNPLDRLCSLFLRGAIAESDYKRDYRDAIVSVVRDYKESFNGPERKHNNILKLYEKWRDE